MTESRWDKFLGLLCRWYGIPATALLLMVNIASMFFFHWLFGPGSKIAFWMILIFILGSIIGSYVIFYQYGKRRYSVGMYGDSYPNQEESYATTEEPHPNRAKFKPDSVSDERIKKIGKKYKKLPPLEE